LNYEAVTKGDTCFIEVGRVHAIGARVMLAEIQQTSDITYRVYDWDRVDDQGNSRELHNDLAIDAIDFNMPNNFKVSYETQQNKPKNLVTCPYFTTNIIVINSSIHKQNFHDSFMIYMAVGGDAVFEIDGKATPLLYGETILIPANIKEFRITSTNAELLEVYI